MNVVWLDGALVPRETARVSVDDLGFLYGAACFETMRAAGGVVFRLARHLERLEAGLCAMGVVPPERAGLEDAVAATLETNGLPDARVRLTVSAGRGNGRPDLSAASAPTVLVATEPLPPVPPPARLGLASVRLDEGRPLPRAKTANYLTSLLAIGEARAAGCDDALVLNHQGRVAETALANVFAVFDGALMTPPIEEGPLPGVTREAVIECASAIGVPVAECAFGLDDLEAAAEIFLTSSIVGVRAVREVAGRWRAAKVPGPLTSAIAEAYERLLTTECGIEVR